VMKGERLAPATDWTGSPVKPLWSRYWFSYRFNFIKYRNYYII